MSQVYQEPLEMKGGIRPATGDSGEPPPGFELIMNDVGLHMPASILNLGSGVHFLLERTISTQFPHLEMLSVDIANQVNPVSQNHTYIKCDLNHEVPDVKKKFDLIIATEVLEHLATDTYFWETIEACSCPSTRIIISTPNLASLFCRLELLFGLQPHVLESSSIHHRAGMGFGARLNYGKISSDKGSIGHIRGITFRSMVELINRRGLEIESKFGFMNSMPFWPRRHLQGFSGSNLFFLTFKR